jgi:ABC-type antimicrobial peptide transport system permease subunit
MILLQAATAGAIGFALGSGMAVTFFEVFSHKLATRGIILLWQSVALTFGCILFVVILASWLSIRRVLILEAATVFRA